jgi:hypothetical protein
VGRPNTSKNRALRWPTAVDQGDGAGGRRHNRYVLMCPECAQQQQQSSNKEWARISPVCLIAAVVLYVLIEMLAGSGL